MLPDANCKLPGESNFFDNPNSTPVCMGVSPRIKSLQIVFVVQYKSWWSTIVFDNQAWWGHAEPNENTLSTMINEAHQSYLILLFNKIILVDTNGIDPECAIRGPTQMHQNLVEVFSH